MSDKGKILQKPKSDIVNPAGKWIMENLLNPGLPLQIPIPNHQDATLLSRIPFYSKMENKAVEMTNSLKPIQVDLDKYVESFYPGGVDKLQSDRAKEGFDSEIDLSKFKDYQKNNNFQTKNKQKEKEAALLNGDKATADMKQGTIDLMNGIIDKQLSKKVNAYDEVRKRRDNPVTFNRDVTYQETFGSPYERYRAVFISKGMPGYDNKPVEKDTIVAPMSLGLTNTEQFDKDSESKGGYNVDVDFSKSDKNRAVNSLYHELGHGLNAHAFDDNVNAKYPAVGYDDDLGEQFARASSLQRQFGKPVVTKDDLNQFMIWVNKAANEGNSEAKSLIRMGDDLVKYLVPRIVKNETKKEEKFA